MIYFVQDEATLNIKIGYTGGDDAQGRIRDLQTGCPSRLVLLAACQGTLSDEKRFHAQFKDARTKGEWFRPTPEILRFIISRAGIEFAARACLRAGDFLQDQEVVLLDLTVDEFMIEKTSRGIKFTFNSADRTVTTSGPNMEPKDWDYIKKNERAILQWLSEHGTRFF